MPSRALAIGNIFTSYIHELTIISIALKTYLISAPSISLNQFQNLSRLESMFEVFQI